jgi:hypothetical protein
MRVSIAPLRLARGTQIKVLMAMAAGRPCVVTPYVAEGIGARAGHHLAVADSPAEFAEAMIDLLNDDHRAQCMGRAGRAFVATRFGPDKNLARLEALLAGPADASAVRGWAASEPECDNREREPGQTTIVPEIRPGPGRETSLNRQHLAVSSCQAGGETS